MTAAQVNETTEQFRTVFLGKAHAACDRHVLDAIHTVEGCVVRVRNVARREGFKCALANCRPTGSSWRSNRSSTAGRSIEHAT
jgi:hypothetical protein